VANAIDIVVNAQDRASSKIKGISKTFNSLKSSAEKASHIIGAGMLALGGAITGVAYAGIKYNAMLETSNAKWTTLLKSQSEAKKQMAWIQKFAKESPFDVKGIDEASTALMGMGFQIKDVRKWIPTLGDVAGVLGGGTETVQGLALALGQMNAKGKVSAEEMQQLAERGVPAWKMLADGMHMSVGEVQKLASDGKLMAKDALPLIQKGMEKAFGGGMQNYMKSTVGQAQQAEEQFQQLAGTLTNGAYTWFGANVLPVINDGLQKLTDMFSGGLIDGFTNLWNSGTKAKIVLVALAGLIGGTLIGALVLAISTFGGAIVAFSGFVAIATAVAGVVALVIANWSTFAPFFKGVFDTVKNAVSGFIQAFMVAFQNLKAGLTPLWEALKSLFNTLKPVLTTIGAVFGTVIGAMLVTAMAVFNGIVSAIAPLITAFVNFADMVANVVKAVVLLLTGDLSGASKAWQKATDSSIKFVKNLWNAFKGFFSGFIGTIVSIFSKFGVDLKAKAISTWNSVKSAFTDGVNKAKSAVTSGLKNIVSAIKGWFSNMIESGKGLIGAFADGIKKGIGKAIDAVKGGMKKIRSFLPFSPAKKGPLSDLDKSGESFFPTWYNGALNKVPHMTRAISGAMGAMNNQLMREVGGVQLESFTGNRQRVSMTVTHEVKGSVDVRGDNGNKESLRFAGSQVETQVSDTIFSDFRRVSRAR